MSISMASLQALRKICKNCGREITWRKKWENTWDTIVYCSATCRRPLGALDRAFETSILDLLRIRRSMAVSSHQKGGVNHSSASCTCEEAEALVLKNWKANPMLEDVTTGEPGGGEGESGEEEEVVPVIPLNRKERRKAAEAANSNASTVESSPPSTPPPPAKVSYIPTFPKISSLSLSDPSPSTSSTPDSNSDSSTPITRSAPRDTRERCRKAARRLVILQAVEIWQGGKIVDPSFAKGVIELKGGINFDLICDGEGSGNWNVEDNWTGSGAIVNSGKLGKKRKGNQKNGRANE